MFRTLLSGLPSVALVVVGALIFAPQARAQDEDEHEHEHEHGKKHKPVLVKGVVTTVVVNGSTGTVTFKPKTGSPITVKVSATTKIEINDKENQTLAALKAAVAGVPTGGQPYSGVPRVDSLTTLNALFISVSNVDDGD